MHHRSVSWWHLLHEALLPLAVGSSGALAAYLMMRIVLKTCDTRKGEGGLGASSLRHEGFHCTFMHIYCRPSLLKHVQFISLGRLPMPPGAVAPPAHHLLLPAAQGSQASLDRDQESVRTHKERD